MKLWATLARYAYRSGEFQVRLPFGCPRRAGLAQREMGVGRVERGTWVAGGRGALRVLEALGAPREIREAAWACVEGGPELREAGWEAFRCKLQQELNLQLHLHAR